MFFMFFYSKINVFIIYGIIIIINYNRSSVLGPSSQMNLEFRYMLNF